MKVGEMVQRINARTPSRPEPESIASASDLLNDGPCECGFCATDCSSPIREPGIKPA